MTDKRSDYMASKSVLETYMPSPTPNQPVAYLHGATLTIVSRPCNGAEYQAGEKLAVSGKREARSICKARGVKPWNF
jgi:hypothetical protein